MSYTHPPFLPMLHDLDADAFRQFCYVYSATVLHQRSDPARRHCLREMWLFFDQVVRVRARGQRQSHFAPISASLTARGVIELAPVGIFCSIIGCLPLIALITR